MSNQIKPDRVQPYPSLRRSKISLKAMLRVLRREGGGVVLEFNGIESCMKIAKIPADLREL